jgi:hypothetical protein
MRNVNLGLSIAAGLLGGLLSHSFWTQPVHAQNAQNQTPASKEVRAQSFVIVNDKGETQGILTFGETKGDRTSIRLYDGKGREIFDAGGDQLRPLSSGLR